MATSGVGTSLPNPPSLPMSESGPEPPNPKPMPKPSSSPPKESGLNEGAVGESTAGVTACPASSIVGAIATSVACLAAL